MSESFLNLCGFQKTEVLQLGAAMHGTFYSRLVMTVLWFLKPPCIEFRLFFFLPFRPFVFSAKVRSASRGMLGFVGLLRGVKASGLGSRKTRKKVSSGRFTFHRRIAYVMSHKNRKHSYNKNKSGSTSEIPGPGLRQEATYPEN